ncbi:hypothetical protein F3Y22_tig00116971pilonHSYRG00789 [Hibiscus syriacus]|uniref:Transposase MuDR plant domain-containing protein n=1 Tax=Hibiscus syriacus TaxID=106335 RepID=A0A6A2X8X8_HIBSY|nr:hypothetical protein F3Y22_tig00116971pilonHSYRG00789 [Hibiscus syriacus]
MSSVRAKSLKSDLKQSSHFRLGRPFLLAPSINCSKIVINDGRESEYFTIVMHHGGFMVSSSGFKYTGNEVHVGVDFEKDFNGLNNRDEGNIDASSNDENETDGVETLYTENESDSESDSDSDDRGKHRCLEFNHETDMEKPQFKVGMIFGDKFKFKEAVRQYVIKNKVDIRFKRTDSVRVYVVCKEGCS